MPEKRGFPTFPLFFYQQYIHQNSLSPFDSPGEEGELKHKMLCREYCLFLISQKNISLIALKVIDSGLQGHSGKISPFIGLKYLNTPQPQTILTFSAPQKLRHLARGAEILPRICNARGPESDWWRTQLNIKQVRFAKFLLHSLHCTGCI